MSKIGATDISGREPVVYLPGIDGTGRLLFRQEQLHARHPVQAVNYPQDDRHQYADLVRRGICVLEKMGSGVVIAESFGGAVGLLIALERPDLVRRLVLVNTFAYYPRRLLVNFLATVAPWLPNRPLHGYARTLRGYFFFSSLVPPLVRDEWWARTDDVPLRVYGHRIQLLCTLDLRPRLGEVKIPTLVLIAPNDWIVPPVAGRLLARRLPVVQALELATGHAALVDPRVDLAELLADKRLWGENSISGSCPKSG